MRKFAGISAAVFVFFTYNIFPAILLHSTFEKGMTTVSRPVKPGQKRIYLLENFRMHQWPLQDGRGIIQGNRPSKMESFSYEKRIQNRLEGVNGITLSHPMGTQIIFGDLREWNEIAPGIHIVDSAAMFGNYACCIPVTGEMDTRRVRTRILPKKELWVRFYIKFSASIVMHIAQSKRLKFHYIFDEMGKQAVISCHLVNSNGVPGFALIYSTPSPAAARYTDTLYSNTR
ncbi:MAG: hypothetical protein ABIA63_04245, partial [bacterium]